MDLLSEIPDENLPSLASLYEKHLEWAPHVLGLIHTVNDKWKEDGTIVVIMKFHSVNIFVFTLDDECVTLRQALLSTNRIHYNNPQVEFFCVHEKHLPVVKEMAEAKKLELRGKPLPYLMFALNPAKAKFTLDCPPDVYVAKLDPALSDRVNAVWPHKYPGSECYIRDLIEMNGGYGVFLRSTNEVVAWVVKHCFGHIGMLQTDERYKKRGYGSLVVEALAKEILEEGQWPFATVYPDNGASVKLFEKMGFVNIGRAAYIWM